MSTPPKAAVVVEHPRPLAKALEGDPAWTVMILLAVISLNEVADGLPDALDPREIL